MDCVDCHNRATHIYQDPEAAVDEALAAGRIDRDLPFAKKVALGALTGQLRRDKDDGLQGIENAVRGLLPARQDTASPVDQPGGGPDGRRSCRTSTTATSSRA